MICMPLPCIWLAIRTNNLFQNLGGSKTERFGQGRREGILFDTKTSQGFLTYFIRVMSIKAAVASEYLTHFDLPYPLNSYTSLSFYFSFTIMSSLDVAISEGIFPSMLAKGDFLLETFFKIPFFKITSVKKRYDFINEYH